MSEKAPELNVVIFRDKTGGYIALVPELPGCHSQGDTLEEIMANVKEVIEAYLEALTPREKKELMGRAGRH